MIYTFNSQAVYLFVVFLYIVSTEALVSFVRGVCVCVCVWQSRSGRPDDR